MDTVLLDCAAPRRSEPSTHLELGITVALIVMVGLTAFVLLAPVLMVTVLIAGMSRRTGPRVRRSSPAPSAQRGR
jgi:hypothetical protein